MRAHTAMAFVVGLLVALTGCSETIAGGDFALAEWSISGPSELPGDIGSVGVTNSGSFPHTLVVTNTSGEVVAATDLIPPGESTEIALDLEAGRYSFTCRIVAQDSEGEIVDHFEAGMNRTVSVSG